MSKTWTAIYKLSIGEWLLYYLLYGTAIAISLIPFCLLYLISDGLCLIVKSTGYRKKVIYKNLKNAFPEKTEQEIQQIINGFYHYFCDYIVETIKLATMSKATMRKRMVYHDLEPICDAMKNGRFVALYLGHFCNWEWVTGIGMHMPEGAYPCQVYHVIESKVFDKLMLKLRSKMNTASIPQADILRKLITQKQDGIATLVGFISDQSPIIYSQPYWTEFLNQPTPFINGTERLIKKFDMLPVYADIRCVRRGHYEITVQVLTQTPKECKEGELTEMYARALEKSIRRQPERWLWSHNRWKHKPSDFVGKAKV